MYSVINVETSDYIRPNPPWKQPRAEKIPNINFGSMQHPLDVLEIALSV
jgi:hypothetical protein